MQKKVSEKKNSLKPSKKRILEEIERLMGLGLANTNKALSATTKPNIQKSDLERSSEMVQQGKGELASAIALFKKIN